MSQQNPVRLFVTHCFTKNDDYLRVFEFLESSTNFYYQNCSDPESVPAAGGTEALKDELRRQIGLSEAVIAIEAAFEDNQDLALFQLNAAQALEKAVIAMERYGVVTELPEQIRDRADALAPWNERMMVDIILREARHEETQRWEVIEFDM